METFRVSYIMWHEINVCLLVSILGCKTWYLNLLLLLFRTQPCFHCRLPTGACICDVSSHFNHSVEQRRCCRKPGRQVLLDGVLLSASLLFVPDRYKYQGSWSSIIQNYENQQSRAHNWKYTANKNFPVNNLFITTIIRWPPGDIFILWL